MLISISLEVIESLNNNELEEPVVNYLTSALSQIIESNENMIVFRDNPRTEAYYQLLENSRISSRLREIIIFLSSQYIYFEHV